MHRLEVLSVDLAAKFPSAPPTKQYAACVLACELPVSKTDIQSLLVGEILEKLRLRRVITLPEKTEIDGMTIDLDDYYFHQQESAEKEDNISTHSLLAFEKARTLAAISFASDGTPNSMAEAIYEAATAIGNDKSDFVLAIKYNLTSNFSTT